MQYPRFNFLCLAHIPEVFSQIPAGPAGDVHLGLVGVVAGGALPLELLIDLDLPVEAAALAVVALGVELGVLDIVVDEPHHIL